MKEVDFLAIGDVVIDAFIELQDAEVSCDVDKENCMLSMRFGDKIPYTNVVVVPAVGNSPNAAVSAARLGLSSMLVTHVGADRNGEDCIAQLSKENISTDLVTTEEGKSTNYHYVLRYGAERTILVKHDLFSYNFDLGEINPKWIYLSSLAENSLEYHEQIADYLAEHPDVKLAFQPGTFQMKLGAEKLAKMYQNAELFFCNVEEARRILKTDEKEIKALLSGIRDLGVNIAIITDGPNGAYTFDGAEVWHMPMYPDPSDPVDRTGAGDSFASTFTSALALGKTIPEALTWGPINSMSVVQQIGAQEGLLSREKLEGFLAEASDDYKPVQI
jgi:ribokinase